MKSKWGIKTLVLLTILVLSITLTWSMPVNAQTNTTMSISPASYTALTCTDSIIAVRVEDVEDLNAYQISLTFTPGSIEVLEVTNGGFLDDGWFMGPTVDNEVGTIYIYMAQLDSEPKDGSGDLIYIRFRALVPGASINVNIVETDSYLYLPTGPEIPFTALNGLITTADCPLTQLSFFPDGATACINQDTTIKVRVADVYDLYSYSLKIGFDPGAIEIRSVENGGFLSLPGLFEKTNGFDNTAGTISFGMSQVSPTLPKDGSGDLISITFRTITPGVMVNMWVNESTSKLVNMPDAFSIPFNATDGIIYTSSCDPNAVELLSFDVLRKKIKAIHTWETASEIDNIGFNLYRSGYVDGTLKKINEELIPAQAVGTTMGAVYEYIDKPLKPWKTYYYWLESVDIYGETSLTGPIEAASPFLKK